MPTQTNRQTVETLWAALSARDWETLKSCLAPDIHYEDVPTPDAGAIGPKAIADRLRVGLGPIENYVHHTHKIVVEGDNIVTEHTEDWHFGDGVVVSLPFVSIHTVENGKFKTWRDYWDMQTLVGGAPQWWLDHIMKQAEQVGLR